MQTQRGFDPWVGCNYFTGVCGVRVLLLGESHYKCDGAKEVQSFTQQVVRNSGIDGRHRFFTLARRLVLQANPFVPEEQREAFWQSVAFYNYVQSYVGNGPRQRPNAQMWLAAREPFLKTLGELKPQVLIVFGKELSCHLPEIDPCVELCRIGHPASRHFHRERNSYALQIREAFDRAGRIFK